MFSWYIFFSALYFFVHPRPPHGTVLFQEATHLGIGRVWLGQMGTQDCCIAAIYATIEPPSLLFRLLNGMDKCDPPYT
jgi:hypothetical protein